MVHQLKIERHDMSVHFVAPDAYLGSYHENKTYMLPRC